MAAAMAVGIVFDMVVDNGLLLLNMNVLYMKMVEILLNMNMVVMLLSRLVSMVWPYIMVVE